MNTYISPRDITEMLGLLGRIAEALEREAAAQERHVAALASIGESLDMIFSALNERKR